MKRDVVLRPAKPARLDVAGDPAAGSELLPADKAAIIDFEQSADELEVDMSPGLRAIGSKGEVRRRALGDVGRQRAIGRVGKPGSQRCSVGPHDHPISYATVGIR